MYILQAIREILLLGHRQAFVWMDDWYNMTIEDVREYEREMQAKTNVKVNLILNNKKISLSILTIEKLSITNN